MAATFSQSFYKDPNSNLKVITINWIADTDGSIDYDDGSSYVIRGCRGMYLVMAKTFPTWGSAGNALRAPSANYDITLTDTDQFSVVSTLLNNRSATAAEVIFPTQVSRPIDSDLTMAISGNSADRARGTLKLYFSANPTAIVAAA